MNMLWEETPFHSEVAGPAVTPAACLLELSGGQSNGSHPYHVGVLGFFTRRPNLRCKDCDSANPAFTG